MDHQHKFSSEKVSDGKSRKNNNEQALILLFLLTLLCTLSAQYFSTKSPTKIDLSKVVCRATTYNGPGYVCTLPANGGKQNEYSKQHQKRVLTGLKSFHAGMRYRAEHLPGQTSRSLTISAARLYSKPAFVGVTLKDAQLMMSSAVSEAVEKLRLMLQHLMSSLGASQHLLAKLAGALALFAQSVVNRSFGVEGASRTTGMGGVTVQREMHGGMVVRPSPLQSALELNRPRGITDTLGSATMPGSRADGRAFSVQLQRHSSKSGSGSGSGSLRKPVSALLNLLKGGREGGDGAGMGSHW